MNMEEMMAEADALLSIKAKNTKKNYMQIYKEMGDIPTKVSVAKYIGACKEKYKPATINIRLAAISWLVKNFENAIPEHSEIQKLLHEARQKPEQEIMYATKEQADVVIANSDRRTALAVGLMFYAGMRISDVVKLKLSDWKKSENGYIISFKNQKTGVVVQIPVCDKLQELYDNYVKLDRTWTMIGFTAGQSTETVLLGRRGALSCSRLFREVKAVCKECGYSELHPHSFRHGIATALAKAKASPSVIKNILGHTGMAMTDRYIHLSVEDKREAIERIVVGGN